MTVVKREKKQCSVCVYSTGASVVWYCWRRCRVILYEEREHIHTYIFHLCSEKDTLHPPHEWIGHYNPITFCSKIILPFIFAQLVPIGFAVFIWRWVWMWSSGYSSLSNTHRHHPLYISTRWVIQEFPQLQVLHSRNDEMLFLLLGLLLCVCWYVWVRVMMGVCVD